MTKQKLKTVEVPAWLTKPGDVYQLAANIGIFLSMNAGSVQNSVRCKLTAAQQKKLFGNAPFGKKTLLFVGDESSVYVEEPTGFGQDVNQYSVSYAQLWRLVSTEKAFKP